MTGSLCLSDEELATPIGANDARLLHLETCDSCRAIWLHARDADEPTWTVGRYQIRGTIGAGGLGVVLLGWDPALHREVAIKFSPARGDAALREAKALAAIRHPNVVAVHDFGELDGDVYITMDRVEGATFDTWWLGASPADRVRALIEVAEGLAAIHAAGLVHCDIKPGNIVVTSQGDVVIVDLGLATPHGDRARLAGGTPGYYAPELERGGVPTVASDEYAFWCVARQCLAGSELSARQRRRLDELVARGTSADPAQRLGSLSACGAELGALLTSRRALITGAAAIASGAVLATAIALLARGSSPSCSTELPAWDRAGVGRQLADRPAVLARVVALVERERTAAHGLLARACEADRDTAWLRARWCVLSGWQQLDGHLRAIARGGDIARSLDELPLGIPAERCAPGRVTASPPAVDTNATPVSRALFASMLAFEGLPPDEHVRRLFGLGPAVEATNNPGLTAAWHLELADAQDRAGNQEDAIASAVTAIDVATRNGDDVVLARARLTAYVLRDVHDRGATTRDAEVEAIVARVGSPGLLATFHDAAGQRAIAVGDIERARGLLERAIAGHAALEVAPSAMRGAAEQNLGVALQFSKQLDEAQLHFDRAVEVFTSRFGPTHDETATARLSAGHNLIYRGRAEEGARALDALASELAAAHRTNTTLGARVAVARCQAALALGRDQLLRCTDALAANRAVFDAGSVELVPPLLAVAQLKMATGVRAALPLLEEAVAIAEKQANNPTDLPYARGLYALALKVVGRIDEGLTVATQALPELERLGQRELAATLRTHFPSL